MKITKGLARWLFFALSGLTGIILMSWLIWPDIVLFMASPLLIPLGGKEYIAKKLEVPEKVKVKYIPPFGQDLFSFDTFVDKSNKMLEIDWNIKELKLSSDIDLATDMKFVFTNSDGYMTFKCKQPDVTVLTLFSMFSNVKDSAVLGEFKKTPEYRELLKIANGEESVRFTFSTERPLTETNTGDLAMIKDFMDVLDIKSTSFSKYNKKQNIKVVLRLNRETVKSKLEEYSKNSNQSNSYDSQNRTLLLLKLVNGLSDEVFDNTNFIVYGVWKQKKFVVETVRVELGLDQSISDVLQRSLVSLENSRATSIWGNIPSLQKLRIEYIRYLKGAISSGVLPLGTWKYSIVNYSINIPDNYIELNTLLESLSNLTKSQNEQSFNQTDK